MVATEVYPLRAAVRVRRFHHRRVCHDDSRRVGIVLGGGVELQVLDVIVGKAVATQILQLLAQRFERLRPALGGGIEVEEHDLPGIGQRHGHRLNTHNLPVLCLQVFQSVGQNDFQLVAQLLGTHVPHPVFRPVGIFRQAKQHQQRVDGQLGVLIERHLRLFDDGQ